MDFFSTENIVSLLTLTFLEIVLGIDNIVFISIVSGRLPASQQKKAQAIGIGLAFLGRIVLLLTITWIIGLSKPFLHFNDFALSYRDLILQLSLNIAEYQIMPRKQAHSGFDRLLH